MVDNDVLKSDLRKQYTQLDYELDRCSSLYEVITEEDYEDFKRYYSKYEFTDLALAHDKFYDVTTYFKLMIKNRKSLENSDKTVGPSKLKGAKFVILTPIGLSETGELSFVYRRYDISEADISYISAAYKKIKKAELTNSDKLRILSEITYKRVKSILESLSSDKKESLPFGEKITLTELKQIYEDEEFNMDSWSKFNSIRLDARDELLTTSCIKVLQKGTNGVSQDETLSKKVEETEQEGYGLSELIDEVYETAITDDDSIIMSDNKVTPDDNDIKDSKDEEEVQSLSSILDEINSTAVSFSNLKSSSEEVNQSDSNDDTSDITSLNGQDEDLSSILSEINTTALSSDEEEKTDDEVVVDSSDEQVEELSSILSEVGEPLTYEQLLSAVGNGEEKSRSNEEKTGESKDGLQSSFVEVEFNVNPESENESKKGGDENNPQDDVIDEELSAILSDLTSSSVPFQRQSSQRESQYNMPDFQIDDSIFSVLTNENLDDFYFHNVSDDSINPENKRKK